MARRGVLAEIQHQMKVAAREKERLAREQERARCAAIRSAEQARKADERAASQLARANAADQKRLAKEAREAHVAAMDAEVERRNCELFQLYDEIDSLLTATLEVDDYVDLATLRTVAEHPPFDRPDLESPTPVPAPIPDPPQPIFAPPPAPQGIRGLMGGKKREKAVAEAEAAHQIALAQWQAAVTEAEAARTAAKTYYAEMEAKRISALEVERARYAQECEAREAAAQEQNKTLDQLISDLSYGAVGAVEEYISIVLSNSVYPDHFQVEHDFEFDPATAELRLKVLLPSPDKLPTTATHKYTKTSDEITTTPLSQKACKDRYTNALLQVGLRSLHEVFEADRRGLIRTVALQVGTDTTDPATGRKGWIPLLAVGAERDSFLDLDLSNVVPSATLKHLGAVVSKNPYELAAIDPAGIRRS